MKIIILLKMENNVKKALIIGSGSIGQRHIRNLRRIGIDNIVALRTMKGHFKELEDSLGVKEVYEWPQAINENPDIAIISNPTGMHLEAIRKILPYVKGIFVEKPLSNTIEGCNELLENCKEQGVVTFVGHNLLFHPIIKSIKNSLDTLNLGKIINLQLQVGQWLPSWHSYENYKESYSSRSDLGGGVSLTLIHEIYIAISLAGMAEKVTGFISNDDELDIDVDIISDLMIKHDRNIVSQIHLDFLQKKPHRSGLISCKNGWISYDFNQNEVTAFCEDDEEPNLVWSNSDYDSNDMYKEELDLFIQFVQEDRFDHDYNFASSLNSLNVIEALKKSNDLGEHIGIDS